MLRLVGTEFADRLRDRANPGAVHREDIALSLIVVELRAIRRTLARMSSGFPRVCANGGEGVAPSAVPALPIDYDLDAWANDRRRRNRRNVDDDRLRLGAVVKGCGWRSIDDASPDSLMVYLATKREAGWKGHTLNKAVCLVSTLLDDVGRRAPHRCPVNWAKGLPRASTDDSGDGSRALTWAEFLTLTEWAARRHADRWLVYMLLGYTGLRFDEARRLSVSEVYLDGNPRLMLTARTKSRKRRTIPLAPEVVELVRRQIGRRKDGPVFLEFPTIRTLRRDCVGAAICTVETEGAIGFHSFRKCFAGRCAMMGVPLAVAQKLLGHSDPKLTSNIYSHFTDGDLAQEVARLGGTQKKVSLNGTKSLDEAGALDDDVPVTQSDSRMGNKTPQLVEARSEAIKPGCVTTPRPKNAERASTRSGLPRDIAGKGTEKSHLRDLNPGPMLYESTGRGLPQRAEAVAQVLDAIARLLREPADDREHKEAV